MTDKQGDSIQHGLDDNPNDDAKKGAALGGVGGAVTGAIAGSMVGPVGTVIGGAIGAVAGAVGSGLAVAAVDRIDNDNTITGLGKDSTTDAETAKSHATENQEFTGTARREGDYVENPANLTVDADRDIETGTGNQTLR